MKSSSSPPASPERRRRTTSVGVAPVVSSDFSINMLPDDDEVFKKDYSSSSSASPSLRSGSSLSGKLGSPRGRLAIAAVIFLVIAYASLTITRSAATESLSSPQAVAASTSPPLHGQGDEQTPLQQEEPQQQNGMEEAPMRVEKAADWTLTVEAAMDIDGDIEVSRHDLVLRTRRASVYPRFVSDNCHGALHRRRGPILYGRLTCNARLGMAERASEPVPPGKLRRGHVVCASSADGVTEFAIMTQEEGAPRNVLEGARPCAIIDAASWVELDAIHTILSRGGGGETIEPPLQLNVHH